MMVLPDNRAAECDIVKVTKFNTQYFVLRTCGEVVEAPVKTLTSKGGLPCKIFPLHLEGDF